MDRGMDEWMGGLIFGWMIDGGVDGWRDEWVDGCIL